MDFRICSKNFNQSKKLQDLILYRLDMLFVNNRGETIDNVDEKRIDLLRNKLSVYESEETLKRREIPVDRLLKIQQQRFEPVEDTDRMIRQRFNIPSTRIYFLVDKSDSRFMSLHTLASLPDETNVSIELQDLDLNRTASVNLLKSVDRETSSFSDNKNEMNPSDLSLTSTSESENDAKLNVNYHSLISHSGMTKKNISEERKKRREANIMCNRKINHFFAKYGNIEPIDYHHVSRDLMMNLNIAKHEIYNLLKFIRNTMVPASLNLNRQNIIDMLSDIYKKNYLHD
ncbi:hypothetical protein I4U23_000778 [Adineta vaga]|nr:hypothetical protein I4U23_000778 [Adineta vaga]